MIKKYFLKKVFYKKNRFIKGRKTLVFVHGLSGSSAAWIPYEKKFEKKYNILSFDLRGHGKSYKPKKYQDYSFKKFAEDLYSLVHHEKIKKFILVCHSYGVFIGLEFLRKHQNLVSSAVFLSPAYKAPINKVSLLLKKLLKSKQLLNIIPLKDGYGRHVDYSQHKNTGDWNIPRMIQDVGNTGLKIYLWGTKQSFNFNAKKVLKKINIPVLLIHGKEDTIFPYSNSLSMHKQIKSSKLVLLEKTDHIIVLNNFKEVSKLIENFIKN